jgi:hypothetical protein
VEQILKGAPLVRKIHLAFDAIPEPITGFRIISHRTTSQSVTPVVIIVYYFILLWGRIL